jgi:hypothetical protein
MKIKSKTQLSKTTKLVIALVVAVALIAVGFFGFMYMKKIGPFTQDTSGINYGPATEEEQQTGDQIKEQNSKSGDATNTGSDPSPAPTPSTDGSKPTVGVEITAANQSNGVLSIRTLVQTLSSGGTCSLSMAGPAGKTYSAVAESQTGPSTSTCKGFDVPVSSLSSGVWTITIQYEDASVKGSASKEVTVI